MRNLSQLPAIVANRCCFPYTFQLRIGIHEMLGSSNAPRIESPEPTAVSGDSQLRDLLIECARSVSQGEWRRSLGLISSLSQQASPEGDSCERAVAQFADSLAARVVDAVGELQAAQLANRQRYQPSGNESQGAYLSFNQITPFVRFSHLTANQAILEAIQGSDRVHVVDFEIMHGVQWPPLMQALAERSGGPPHLRISGTGSDADVLEQTGDRLMKFAASLGLPFEFRAICANRVEDVSSFMLDTKPGEDLAVNCVLQLHHLWHSDGERVRAFLTMIHSLNPKVVTLAEREATYDQPTFIERFLEAFQHYSALFDSLEATLPPTSAERISVERVWLRREITSVLAPEGIEMQRSCSKWRLLFKAEGFDLIPHSTFALSQARLLLRLHYPSEGYQLREEDDCLVLGWQETSLFAVSAWK